MITFRRYYSAAESAGGGAARTLAAVLIRTAYYRETSYCASLKSVPYRRDFQSADEKLLGVWTVRENRAKKKPATSARPAAVPTTRRAGRLKNPNARLLRAGPVSPENDRTRLDRILSLQAVLNLDIFSMWEGRYDRCIH